MLLVSDLVALEDALWQRGSWTLEGSWDRVDKLSRAWRQPWVRIGLSLGLPSTPAGLAVVQISGRPACVVATDEGRVGILALEDERFEAPTDYAVLHGFDPATDEIRNILGAPRRLSTEHDLFILARRWRRDSAPPQPILWRAVCWIDDQGTPRLRPVVERVQAGRHDWAPVPLPDDAEDVLPGWLYAVPLQASLDDPLAPGALRGVDAVVVREGATLAAVCRGAAAWSRGDASVTWQVDGGPVERIELTHPPAALTVLLDREERPRLIVACTDGRIYGPLGSGEQAGAQPTHELEATPTVIGALRDRVGLDLMVGGQDRALTRWRYIGRERLARVWKGVVDLLHKRLATHHEWTDWARGGDGAPPGRRARHLLWLHAAWSSPDLLPAFCKAIPASERQDLGARIGQELANLLAEESSPELRARALQVYRAGGLSLREQFDHARMIQVDDELARRSVQNYWEAAVSEEPVETADAIGNLATRAYVHEATWKAEGVRGGVISRGVHRHFVVARKTGAYALRLPPGDQGVEWDVRSSADPFMQVGQPPHGATSGRESRAAEWRWARSLHANGDRYGVVFGGVRGTATLICPVGGELSAQDLDGDPLQDCVAAMNLSPPSDQALHLGLLWTEGPRAFLDEVRVDLSSIESRVSVSRRVPVPVPVTSADATRLDERTIVAAGSRTRRLELLELGETCGLWRGAELDSAVVNLRFADLGVSGAAEPALVAGTQGGYVWCLDLRRLTPRWVFDAGGAITSIDVVGRGEAVRVAVSAAPHLLVVLDAHGRRRWRHRIGRRPSDLSLVPGDQGEPARLVVLDDRGMASLYRHPDTGYWRSRAVTIDEPHRSDWVRAVVYAREHRYLEGTGEISDPEARRALMAEAAGYRGLSAEVVDAIVDGVPASAEDLEAMARELPEDVGLARWEALWDRALKRVEDATQGPDAAEARMVAELLAYLRRRGATFAYVTDRLADLCAEGDGAGERLMQGHGWTAMQAAHAWAASLESELGTLSGEAVLQRLHLLPPAAARQLRYFIPDAPLAALVAELGEGAVSRRVRGDRIAELAVAVADQGPTLRALRAALRLETLGENNDAWSAAERLLRASRELPAASSPLVAALRQPAVQAPNGELPEATWRLDRQARWLTEALGRRLTAPESGSQRYEGWAWWIDKLLRWMELAWRHALVTRLTAVVARVRPRLSAYARRWTGDVVELGLELNHEGPLAIEAPSLEIGLSPGHAGAVVGGPWTWQGVQLGPEDPPLRGLLSVRVPPESETISLRLRTLSGGQMLDESDWPVVLGGRALEAATSNLLLDTPSLWGALRARLEAVDRGVAVLALDGLWSPLVVVQRLLDLPRSDVVDLDGPLRELGPGRAWPEALTLQAILRVLGGHGPRDATRSYAAGAMPRLSEGPGRVYVAPCQETISRLLESELRAVWAELVDALRAHATARRRPAFILVLPSDLAARTNAAFGDDEVRLLRPARVERGLWESPDLVANVARRMHRAPHAASAAIVEAAGDLRLLEERQNDRPERALEWLRADLAGLAPRELAALVGLSGARTRLPVDQVQEGMVAAEDVETRPISPGRPKKVLASEGRTIRNPPRLASIRQDLLVRGLRGADLSEFPEEERRLLELVGFGPGLLRSLQARGLLEARDGLLTLRPDLARVLGWLRSQRGHDLQQCIEALGDGDTWWSAVRLPELVNVTRQDLEQVRPDDAAGVANLCRNVGRLWRDSPPMPSVCASLCETLTGAPPLATSGVPDPEGRAPTPFSASFRPPEATRYKSATLHFLPEGGRPPRATPCGLDVYLGPGVDMAATLYGVRIGDRQMRAILRSADPRAAFWTTVRLQTGGDLLSPFTHSGALPVGSPLFVGRTEIRRKVAAHLKTRSFLILGARQLGKTTLLHQLFHEARQREDVDCVLVDCQGRDTPDLLLPLLRAALGERGLSRDAPDADEALRLLREQAADRGRTLVLFMNEIDGMLLQAPDLLQRLRAQHEEGLARFVFVGYATARWALDDGHSPLFHFTSGAGGRAFHLGPLAPDESRELLAWLTRPPLSFQWADARHREQGEALLAERAYHIPWVLQDLCQSLVEQLTARRLALIRVDDVRRLLRDRKPFLDRLDAFDLAAAMGRSGGAEENLAREGGRLMLLLLAQRLYFAEGGRARFAELLSRVPESVAFRTDEVLGICARGLDALPLLDQERALIEDWLSNVPLARFLQALSLSLILAPAARETEPAWCFQGHIYPAELRRAEERGGSVEDRVHDQAQRLLSHLRRGAKPAMLGVADDR